MRQCQLDMEKLPLFMMNVTGPLDERPWQAYSLQHIYTFCLRSEARLLAHERVWA